MEQSKQEPKKLTASNECYSCIHRRNVAGNAHIKCAKPDPEMKGDPHGINKGWFFYPLLFDPAWKAKECANFEPKEGVIDARNHNK